MREGKSTMSTEARLGRGARVVVWFIRVLAIVEVADSLVYLGQGGGFSAPTLLIALVVAGIVGLGLTWLPRPLAVIGTGGILVATAPAIVYPLSGSPDVSVGGVICDTGAWFREDRRRA